MRATLVALALLLPLLPVGAAQGATLHVAYEGPSPLSMDLDHLDGKMRFRVENSGSQADYVTIPRTGISWIDSTQPSLAYQSPEFGRALAPGASGEMWIGYTAPRAPGNHTLRVQFQSLATGQTVDADVPVVVNGTPAPRVQLQGVVVDDAGAPLAGARVTDTPLDGSLAQTQSVPGSGFTLQLLPGLHEVRVDAPGREGAGALLNATPGVSLAERFALGPAPERIAAANVTNATVGDSVWQIGASKDLRTILTAPMNHNDHGSTGAFWGVVDGAPAWHGSFDSLGLAASQTSGWQANDATAAVSANGTLAAALDWNGVVHVYDARTGAPRWSASQGSDVNPSYPPGSPFAKGFLTVGATAISPDDARVAAGGANGHLVMFDAATGTALWTRDYANEIRALLFSPDGERLYVGAGDWALHAVDAATGAPLWDAPTEFWPFFAIAQSADGSLLAEGGKDGTLREIAASNGTILQQHDLSPGFVTGFAVSQDRLLASRWTSGAYAFDASGNLLWARGDLDTAVLAATEDGRHALVGYRDFDNGGGFELLDANGTSLYRYHVAAAAAPCTTDLSPFPASQFQSLRLREESPGQLRFVAACIGGGVVTGTFRVETTPGGAPSTATPALAVQPGGGNVPGPAPGSPPSPSPVAPGAPPTGASPPAPPPSAPPSPAGSAPATTTPAATSTPPSAGPAKAAPGWEAGAAVAALAVVALRRARPKA